jgi:FkbH-like protein
VKKIRSILRGVLILYHILGLATLASVLLGLGCWQVCRLTGSGSPGVWIALSPILYSCWLVLTLALSALNIQIIARSGWQKPRRFETTSAGYESRDALLVYAVMLRALMVWSLPGVKYLLRIHGLDRLLLYSYAPRVPIGRNAQVFGLLYDPELTNISEGAMIGGDCTLSAHSVTTKPDGGIVFLSAPINIGPRAVIGANSRVSLGASIGADSIILPDSSILPYSQIPANQVWGGNPATFVRSRNVSEGEESTSPEATAAKIAERLPVLKVHEVGDEDLLNEICGLVAETLSVARNGVSRDFCCDDCPEWDSLAQMAIAAALYNRFGVNVTSEEIFALRSVSDLCRLVGPQTGSGEGSSPESESLPPDPESLPLLDTETATRLLSRPQATNGESKRHEVDVIIASTFTAEPLVPALNAWTGAFGIKANTQVLGFNRVQEFLLADDSPLRANSGINIVLARPEDLLAMDAATAEDRVDSMLDALDQCARKSAGRLVVASLPPVVSELHWLDAGLVAKTRAKWNARIAKNSDLEVLDLAAIVEKLGLTASRAQAMELQTRSPYSPQLYQELGRAASRAIRKRFRPPAKVLALDADNTLWGGVVAEEGPGSVQVGADGAGRAFQLFQEAVLALRQRGVLLVLVSRNEPADVWSVFDNHPGMRLNRSHITASRINWKPKSQNLRDLAAELNVGLDSFVFVDDDPANREEVSANAPEVTVVPLPVQPEEYVRTLTQLWVFDSTTRVTSEDRERPLMMQQEQERQQLKQSRTDMGEYLRDLKLRVEMREATTFDLSRVAQLEQKTNQFNLSLRRRSLDELRGLAHKHPIFVVQATDRFGDYGLIGACMIAPDDRDASCYRLETLILSCRSLGRGIEEAVLDGVLREVQARGGGRLEAVFVTGPRNEPVRAFLRQFGFAEDSENHFSIPVKGESRLPVHIEWVEQRSRLAG